MSLLLDTNALLWVLINSLRLGEQARAAIRDPNNLVLVSAISAWEIAVKVAQGKLHAPPNVGTWLSNDMAHRGFVALPVEIRHAAAVEHLALHHRDPFDRLLIAQATVDGLTIITADRQFEAYDVRVIRC